MRDMATEQAMSPSMVETGEQELVHNDNSAPTLTIRMIMQGKEVGSIIGKKGDNVKKFREESGAKINISDSSCPERIVTVTGSTDAIFKAYTMICKKFEEDIQNTPNSGVPKPPVTIRLIIPASQCGSLIGKGGSKIKEIREVTGALIQVASEMLPNSTERTVTISGGADSITQCIYHICCVMLESPPKGATIPYRPKPSLPPVLIAAGGHTYAVTQGQYTMPTAPDVNKMALQQGLMQPGMMHFHAGLQHQGIAAGTPYMNSGHGQPGAVSYHGMQPGMVPAGMAPAGLPGGFGRVNAIPPSNAQTHEMTIPNDLIGCIIGRGGSKINEIRQLSGAQIKIANADEGSADRKVTITGAPEMINAAQYLINASIEMHKTLTLETPSTLNSPLPTPTTPTLNSCHPAAPLAGIPLNQLVKTHPLPLLGLGLGHTAIDSAANRKHLHTGGATMAASAATKLAAAMASTKDARPRFAPY